MPEFDFVRDDAASRYVLSRGGEMLSVLDFRDDSRAVTLTRAYTIPSHRGHGYAAEVVARAVDDLRQRGDRTIVPMCWYVAEWFDAHPEQRDLLDRGAA